MGRQVRFLLDDDGIAMLDQHLREVGAVSIPHHAPSRDLDAHPGIPQTDASWFSDIIRSEDVPNARRYFQPTPWADPPSEGYWRLDTERLPTVDYMRGIPTDPQNPGRLHFDTTRIENEQIVPVDPAFMAWASELLRWVRKTFPYDSAAHLYTGPPNAARSKRP